MITFENEDKEYLQWLRNHEHGYVLNRRNSPANTFMVHTTQCSHINEPSNENYEHTVIKSKMCSDSAEDVQAWADAKGFSVVECGDCKPYK